MLSEIPAVKVLTERLDINMVWFDLEGEGWSPAKIVSELEQRGVLVYPPLDSKWRLVCHMDVDDDAMSYASRQLAEVLSSR
jgi:threonine aldolase